MKLALFGAVGVALLFGFADPAGAQQPPAGEPAPAATPAAEAAPLPLTPAPANVASSPASATPAAADAATVTTLAMGAPAAEAVSPPSATQQEDGEAPVEEGDRTHANEECLHIIEGDPEATGADCEEAANPLIPEWNEIIWGGLAFVVVFFFLAKFGLPQIKGTMNARTERIRGDLQAAEDQKSEAETLLAEYRAQLNDARAEAGRIIEEARQAADQVRRDQEAALQADLADLRQRAVADIDAAKIQAMTDLRSDVAQIAIGAAETIVGQNLDADTQNQLVEQYIDELAARRS